MINKTIQLNNKKTTTKECNRRTVHSETSESSDDVHTTNGREDPSIHCIVAVNGYARVFVRGVNGSLK